MILSPAFTAVCDGCGGTKEVHGAYKRSCSWAAQEESVRKRLARYGWGYIDEDLCPDCVAKFIYEEKGNEHRTRENVGRGMG